MRKIKVIIIAISILVSVGLTLYLYYSRDATLPSESSGQAHVEWRDYADREVGFAFSYPGTAIFYTLKMDCTEATTCFDVVKAKVDELFEAGPGTPSKEAALLVRTELEKANPGDTISMFPFGNGNSFATASGLKGIRFFIENVRLGDGSVGNTVNYIYFLNDYIVIFRTIFMTSIHETDQISLTFKTL